MNQIRSRYLTALDIGTTKIACLVAHVSSNGLRVVGHSISEANGFKKGVIVDINEASKSVKNAILDASSAADYQITEVIVNVSSTLTKSMILTSEIEFSEPRQVSESDIHKLINQVLKKNDESDYETIHQMPISYSVDGTEDVPEPVGLFAQKIGVAVHVISVPTSVIQNLNLLMDRCALKIVDKAATIYAISLATLTEDEKKSGVSLIDLGGGLTNCAIFNDGLIQKVFSLPFGQQLITSDLYKVLKISDKEAERIKTLYGAAFTSPIDERKTVDVIAENKDGEKQVEHYKRSYINSIISARVDEMLGLIYECLETQKEYELSIQKIVLCGGGSFLQGIKDRSEFILEANVRLGRIKPIDGIPEDQMPFFTTAIGLLNYGMRHKPEEDILEETTTFFKRMKKWIKQSF